MYRFAKVKLFEQRARMLLMSLVKERNLMDFCVFFLHSFSLPSIHWGRRHYTQKNAYQSDTEQNMKYIFIGIFLVFVIWPPKEAYLS